MVDVCFTLMRPDISLFMATYTNSCTLAEQQHSWNSCFHLTVEHFHHFALGSCCTSEPPVGQLLITAECNKLAGFGWVYTVQSHTHTHTAVLLLFWNLSGTTRVSRYEKGKTRKGQTKLDLLEQEIVSGSSICSIICKSAPHPRQPRRHPTTQFLRASHGWISQKRLKLGSHNFHHTVAPSL